MRPFQRTATETDASSSSFPAPLGPDERFYRVLRLLGAGVLQLDDVDADQRREAQVQRLEKRIERVGRARELGAPEAVGRRRFPEEVRGRAQRAVRVEDRRRFRRARRRVAGAAEARRRDEHERPRPPALGVGLAGQTRAGLLVGRLGRLGQLLEVVVAALGFRQRRLGRRPRVRVGLEDGQAARGVSFRGCQLGEVLPAPFEGCSRFLEWGLHGDSRLLRLGDGDFSAALTSTHPAGDVRADYAASTQPVGSAKGIFAQNIRESRSLNAQGVLGFFVRRSQPSTVRAHPRGLTLVRLAYINKRNSPREPPTGRLHRAGRPSFAVSFFGVRGRAEPRRADASKDTQTR